MNSLQHNQLLRVRTFGWVLSALLLCTYSLDLSAQCHNDDLDFICESDGTSEDVPPGASEACPAAFIMNTPYNSNNGQRGAMFDVVANNSVIIRCFEANLYAGTTGNYEIYYKSGTHVGHENNVGAWTFIGGATGITSSGNNVPTPLPISVNVTIPAGERYAFYITNDFGGGTSYTDGTAVGNFLAADANLTVYEGVGKSYPFGLTFTVRNFNGHIFYDLGGAGADAGADQTNCDDGTFTMAANAAPPSGSASWSLISGTANITSNTNPQTTVTGVPLNSSATLRWTYDNGTSTSTDDVVLTNDQTTTWYIDADGDDYGTSSIMQCGRPTDGFLLAELMGTGTDDCNDGDADEFPGQTWYIDADGDDYGSSSVVQCGRPTDGFLLSEIMGTGTDDCDDSMMGVNPGATEVCDGIDNNCDNMIDDVGIITWYRDNDMDSYGDPLITKDSCAMPAGFVLDNTDCDDGDGDEFPGQIWYIDADGDGYGTSGVVQCERPANGYLLSELMGTGTDDCDDTMMAVNPGAIEICDGIDNNCDMIIDDVPATSWYRDSDMDGFGDPAIAQEACNMPMGFVADNTDCNDSDANEFPGQTWYIDADGDNYGTSSLVQCARPTNGFLMSEIMGTGIDDCDDSMMAVNPGATEICDGIDNNCDNIIDDVSIMTWYQDSDMDGFGNPAVTQDSCAMPTGFVVDNTDCNDSDANEFPGQTWHIDADGDDYGTSSLVQCTRPASGFLLSELMGSGTDDCDDSMMAVNPSATEICDGIDNNCDNIIDDVSIMTWYQDNDMDGFGNPAVTQDSCAMPTGFVADNTDCNDSDANEFPGQTWYIDADGDDYGASSISQCARPANGFLISEIMGTGTDDCDDSMMAVNPSATEICDGIDNNCDNVIDDVSIMTWYQDNDMDGFGNPAVTQDSCAMPTGFVADNTDCNDSDANEVPGQTWYIDADGDDYGTSSLVQCSRPANGFLLTEIMGTGTDDCDDSMMAVNPGATEVCDGIDNNCDNIIDDVSIMTWYQDSDMDGFGNPAVTQDSCAMPTGFVADNTDCNDSDANEFPGQTWYIDADGDNYGTSSLVQCARPTNGFLISEIMGTGTDDCDDSMMAVNPGATEICDGIDNNCDNIIDDVSVMTWYQDSDMDGFGNPAVTQDSCAMPTGFVADNTDCNDSDANEFPGQTWYIDADGDNYGTSSLVQCARPTNGFLISEIMGTGTDDCDDSMMAVNPGATEVCDGIDNNCDNVIDDVSIMTWYQDNDMDGFGNPAVTQDSCAMPTGFVADNTDCNDSDASEFPGQTWYIDADGDDYGTSSISQCARPANGFLSSELMGTGTDDCNDTMMAVNPNATEVCDGIDNNCDNIIDDVSIMTWYQDSDMDGFGNPAVTQDSCAIPTGFVADNTDCNDSDANEFPGQIWYIDADGDNYGTSSLVQCARPTNGFLMSEIMGTGTDDCDDSMMAVNPGATEICDGIDNNCDDIIDDVSIMTWYQDSDMDGFGNPAVTQDSCAMPIGYVADNTDCNDSNPNEFPGQTWYIDADGDNYGTSSLVQCARPANGFLMSEIMGTGTDDCDDSMVAVNPGATEICDGIDNNCDDIIDDGETLMTWYRDQDMDGFGDPIVSKDTCSMPLGYVSDNTDCDDGDSDEYPGQIWYIDMDGDGYGSSSLVMCERPMDGYLLAELMGSGTDDCNDDMTAVNPGSLEICDGLDNNCNNQIDTDDTTLVDNDVPDVICQNLTIELNAEGIATITAEDIDNGSSDNCGINDLSIDRTDFSCVDTGLNLVTLIVEDVNGNIDSCSSWVTILPHAPAVIPQITGPQMICSNINDIPYETQSHVDVAHYQWTYSGDGLTISNNGSHQVRLSCDSQFSPGILSVELYTSCGSSGLIGSQNIDLGDPQQCETISCPMRATHTAVDTETVGDLESLDTYLAANRLESDAVIPAPRNILFRAGMEVDLLTDFQVENGATFVAEIGNCPSEILRQSEIKER